MHQKPHLMLILSHDGQHENVCSSVAHEYHVYPLGVLEEDVCPPGELEECLLTWRT